MTRRNRLRQRSRARSRSLAILAALAISLAPLATAPGSASAESPLPDASPLPGQSDQPAPASREKLVLDHGHIDAFTPVLNNGRGPALNTGEDESGENPELPILNPDGVLQLMVKEDVTELNRIRNPEELILHVKPEALDTIPAGFVPGLSGSAYHLPLIQDQSLIWPGWETQLITEEFPGANSDIIVSEVDGPGEVFLWSQNTLGAVVSLMHGDYSLPATISQPYPAHTHAAWAFTEPGSYELTVRLEVEAAGGRAATTQTAVYTFVVGDLAAHTTRTATVLEADAAESDPGAPVTFTARVDPAAVGAVQFRDATSGTILGHTPVGDDGTASFRTAALQPGERRIVAEFVPSWSNDHAPSESQELVVTVSGEQIPRPEGDDTIPVSEDQLAALQAGEGVLVTSPDKTVRAGSVLTATVGAEELHGDWVSVWLHGAQVWLGWVQLDLLGGFTVEIPEQTGHGEHRLVVKDREGGIVGWDVFTVPRESQTPVAPTPPVAPPRPAPSAPPQQCEPAVTLDHGHIDAFTVSAGGGMAVLQILEDVTGHRVLREAETVLLRVKESAYASIPGLPGGPAGYVLPLTQNPDLIWPGWDTNRTAASGYTDVSINVTNVAGPGQVFLYTSQGAFGGWRPILTHGGYTLPGTIHEPSPAHTHAQWVFSEKGVYVLTAHAVATNPRSGAGLSTLSHTYVFQVGDVPLGDVFCGLNAHGAGASELVNAAVHRAGLEAIAAEQAEAEKAKEDELAEQRATPDRDRSETDEHGSPLTTTPGSVLHPAAIAGVIGGGVIAIAGIIGGTVWFLRRPDAGASRRLLLVLSTAAVLLGVLIGASGALIGMLAPAQQAASMEAAALAAGSISASEHGQMPARGGTAGQSATAAGIDPEWLSRTASAAGIPERMLLAYAEAAARISLEQPGCGLGWNTLAGIGFVESEHGTIGGSRVGDDGVARPRIIGIALDGATTEAIPDTDAGVLDGDAVWDRAVGPMQFIPSSWELWGSDGDGARDPQNIDAAAYAAARYLCAVGGDLTVPSNWIRAVAAYNDTVEYNNRVAEAASHYARVSENGSRY